VNRSALGALALGGAVLGAAGLIAWQADAFQAAQIEAVPDEGAAPVAPPPVAPAESESNSNSAAPAETAKAAAPTPPPQPLATAETPMNERVAVLGLLNKRNGESRDLTIRPGQAIRVRDVIVRMSACETTAPWEDQKLTGAFVQLDVRNRDGGYRRAFSGWLYKESPSLNAVQDPVYDVWPKSCTMVHPDIGPATVRVSGSVMPSIAKKSAGDQKAPPAAPATETPSAESSNAT
jgi:hypothetical protein